MGSQDIYFLLAIALMVAALILKIPIPYLGRVGLGNLILPVITLLARAFLPPQLTGYLLFIFLLALILSIYFWLSWWPLGKG